MTLKKIILILLLIFSLVSLFVIVYFSKNRIGMFGKIYDDYIRKNTEIISQIVQSNMITVKGETKAVSEEDVVKSIFESYFLRLASIDSTPLGEIKNKIPLCIKIQLIDKDGVIVHSTIEEERLTQKIKSSILEKIQSHFSVKETPFVYFLNKEQFLSILPVSYVITNTIYYGYVALYYNTAKLLANLPRTGKLKIPFSFENFVFLSSGNIDNKDINLILQNYENLKGGENEGLEKTIGGISQFDGIKLVYYAKNEKFISPWTIFFIVIDLILLMLVIFTLLQLGKEEKLYRGVALSSLKTDTVSGEKSEIGELVRDIEEEKIYEEGEAKEGIEEMIMQNQVEFFPPAGEEVYEKIPELKESALPEQTYELKEEVEEIQSIEPDHKTKLFAEEEGILEGISNSYIETEESLKEKVTEEVETEKVAEPSDLGAIEESIEFGIPEVENVKLAEDLEKIEEAAVVTTPKRQETKEELEADLHEAMVEPPKKLSTIATVEDYGGIVLDLCKNNLGMSKILILKRENSHFTPIIQEGFKSSNITFDIDDPLVKLFFSKGKCVDIKGNLNSIYLQSKFSESDISGLEELFVMPIIKKDEIVGIAFYGRESGVPEASNFQKSELFNMGYLQDE